MPLSLKITRPGMSTTVQDFGRWGHQAMGMPVAGAMDPEALAVANILAGNDPGSAALEITLLGPTMTAEGDGTVAVAGADLGFCVNGIPAPQWTCVAVKGGDVIAFSGPKGRGCRAVLAVSGGIGVPLVMGSRSTYTRAGIGGFEGRALKTGDTVVCGELPPLWKRTVGFCCPEALRPLRDPEAPIRAVPGPQDDAFTEEGLETLFGSIYTISTQADRMGYRMEGPKVAHKAGADIVSDAIPLGAVQVPGHGQPIVMLADRQTTGGYTKAAVVLTVDLAVLAQRMPKEKVRFVRSTPEEGAGLLAERSRRLAELCRLRAEYRSRPAERSGPARAASGGFTVRLGGKTSTIEWQEL
jgi:antagonist of KipI